MGARRGRYGAGRLVVIGGAECRERDGSGILGRFVELAGGTEANLLIIATASSEPDVLESAYAAAFQRCGATAVRALRLVDREQANGDEAVTLLRQATGVFFTGGDQRRITTVIGGTRVYSQLHTLVADGMVLGGTSAGAAMMSSTMIVGGDEVGVTPTSVHTGAGLEFLPGVVIDMHFAERGRLNRLLTAVALYPHELGLGIDEDTAIVVEAGRFEVIGSGSVTVIDAGLADMIRIPADGDRAIALTNARIHVLPAGFTFELTGRCPSSTDEPVGPGDRGRAP